MRSIVAPPVIAILLAPALAAAADADLRAERVVKKDGTTIQGEITGFENGKYAVRVGDSLVYVPAADVKTIEEGRYAPAPRTPSKVAHDGTLGVREILEALSARGEPRAAKASVDAFHDAVAAVLRGEWDFGLRVLGRLIDGESGWSDPQILHGIVLLEQGDLMSALASGLRLERRFAEDSLALRVAAEIFRRNGFIDQYTHTMERALAAELTGERLDYELAHLLWPLDPDAAREYWTRYREADGELRQPWCREGEALRRARVAAATEDWLLAQRAIDDLVQRFPWMVEESRAVRSEILTARLRAAEGNGQLEVALVAAASLSEVEPARQGEWSARLHSLRTMLLQEGLCLETVESFHPWSVRHLHLLEGAPGDWRARAGARYQTLALEALARGETEAARRGLSAGLALEAGVRPEGFEGLWTTSLARIRDELGMGRRMPALAAAALLRESYPERAERLDREVAGLYRAATGEEIPEAGLLSGSGAPAAAATAGSATGGDAGAEQAPLSGEERRVLAEKARPTLARYFPHDVGTTWIYRRGDGTRETRRVSALTPGEDGGIEVIFQVREDGAGSGGAYETRAYFSGSDVVLGHSQVPPGEYALRFPLSDNAEWAWSKELFHYARRVRRPPEPLQIPTGSYRDYVIVEAENRIESPGADAPVSVATRLYYAAGLGLVRVESENESIARVLIEFRPGDAR